MKPEETHKRYISSKLREFENKTGNLVLFGGIIGSLSQSLSRSDSDIDLRFIYISRSLSFLPENQRHDEHRIRHRIKEPTNICNTIALWEVSAFINFMIEPYINQGEKQKLKRNVIWTIRSKLKYDPAGISNILEKYISNTVDLREEFNYHYKMFRARKESVNDNSFKEIAHAMYHFLSCKYILDNRSLSPISINELIDAYPTITSQGFIKRLKESHFVPDIDVSSSERNNYIELMKESNDMSYNDQDHQKDIERQRREMSSCLKRIKQRLHLLPQEFNTSLFMTDFIDSN